MSANVGADLAARLRIIRDKAAEPAPVAACKALGQAGETAIKVMLSLSSHPPGTPTPSRPGQPPSLITGELRRSVILLPPGEIAAYTWSCFAGPTAVYARVQEFGATIHPGSSGYLANRATGQFFVTPRSHRGYVEIPARPYVRAAVLMLRTSGLAAKAAATGWNTVMDL